MSKHESLGPGDSFPQLNLETIGGQELVLPRDVDGKFGIVLFYRGHW